MGSKRQEIPYIPLLQHRVYILTPGAFGCTCEVVDPAVELNHV